MFLVQFSDVAPDKQKTFVHPPTTRSPPLLVKASVRLSWSVLAHPRSLPRSGHPALTWVRTNVTKCGVQVLTTMHAWLPRTRIFQLLGNMRHLEENRFFGRHSLTQCSRRPAVKARNNSSFGLALLENVAGHLVRCSRLRCSNIGVGDTTAQTMGVPVPCWFHVDEVI
jgi:hypothetical protein